MRRALLLLLALAACDGVSSDRGLDASMTVAGARFVEGAMPAATSGPKVVSLDLSSNAVHAGEIEKPLRGALDPEATAAAIGLAGDRGYWVLPAGLADVSAPGYPTFDAALSFSPSLRPGDYQLVVRATDAKGRLGAPEERTLTASARPEPAGALVVSLRWDTEADLDLHVVDPAGQEIWKGDISTQDPDAGTAGGALDFDSNAACVIDGRREENVIWPSAPPSGHYRVRVDTFSLCDDVFASWRVEVRLDGAVIANAEGESLEADADLPHGLGAGLLALDFDVP